MWTGKIYSYQNELEFDLKNGAGKGKYYYDNGKLMFEGEHTNGELNGKGKKYNSYGNLIFEGVYLNWKMWNGKSKEYNCYGELLFENEYINGNIYNFN